MLRCRTRARAKRQRSPRRRMARGCSRWTSPPTCPSSRMPRTGADNLCKRLFDSYARVFPHHLRSPTTMFACRRSSWFDSLFDSLDSTLRLVRFPITCGHRPQRLHVAAAAGLTRYLTRCLTRYLTRSTRHCDLSERTNLYYHTQGAAGGDVPRVPDALIGGRHRQCAHHREGAE